MSPEQKIITGLILISAFFILVVFFVIALTGYIHKRKRALLFEQKVLQSTYENELLKTKLEVQEQTLQHISQEIHDNIGQSLSFIKLTVALVDLDNRTEAAHKLSETNTQLVRTIRDLRELSQTLNADYFSRAGLVECIQRQVELMKRAHAYTVSFDIDGEMTAYPAQQELILYRIFQEIVNNIIKHAQAKSIQIRLNYQADQLQLSVQDDGIGFDQGAVLAAAGRGIGLDNISTRMKIINGLAVIDSQPGAGTRVVLTLRH